MGGSYGSYNSQLGNASNSYGTAGNIYGTSYKAQMSADAASAAGTGQLMGQLGAAYITKTMADGGKVHEGGGRVRGIGGPVDDKIDAKLSNGEYVLPADTVKAIGVSKLDKIVKKTHTPAAIQRRQAISARG
jgi:hypothetical protein